VVQRHCEVFLLPHLALAALRANSVLCSGVSFFILAFALALPPFLPRATAAGSFFFLAILGHSTMLNRLRRLE
jgi:hypothetical protein